MSFSTDTHNPAPLPPLQPLIEALIEFHRAVPTIKKTGKAQYGQYADLETVLSTVTPCLLENGLVVSQGFEPSNHDNNPILVTQLLHVSGAKLISRLPMVVAGRGTNPLHDWGSSCTYSRRYSLLSILGLTADMDVDGNFADDQPTANGVAPCEPAPVKAKPSAEYKRQPTPKEIMDADKFFAWTDRISKLDKKTNWPEVEIKIRENKDFDTEQRKILVQKLTEAKASALAVKP
mgnify:CR=1 FL=1